MRAAFQSALADLTASPALCRAARTDPAILRNCYELTDREWRQLSGVVGSRGMEANCILYRANRLAPVALNLPDTCEALGARLTPLISAYWESEPTTDVHFLIEADRFCRFLRSQADLPVAATGALDREHRAIIVKLRATRHMGAGFEA